MSSTTVVSTSAAPDRQAYAAEVQVSTASAIVVSESDPYRILVGDSEKHPNPVIPGGKLESKDVEADTAAAAVQCATREVTEEVGTPLIDARFIGVAADPQRDVRIVPSKKLTDVVVAPALPADIGPEDRVKAHYGCPDFLFIGTVNEREIRRTEELNPRFIDVRLVTPGSLSAGHDVVVMWYRYMLDRGLTRLPDGALIDFAADRERLAREFEAPPLFKGTLAPIAAPLVEAAMRGALTISQTTHGVSNTSCSAEKPKLDEGAGLADRSIQNLRTVLTRVLGAGGLPLNTPEDVLFFIENSARQLNDGLGAPVAGPWRTFDIDRYGRIPHGDLPDRMWGFAAEFCRRYNDPTESSVTLAAWFERRFNGVLHPLSDGCTRMSLLMAAVILAREGLAYPQFASRDQYYENVTGDADRWSALYAGLTTAA